MANWTVFVPTESYWLISLKLAQNTAAISFRRHTLSSSRQQARAAPARKIAATKKSIVRESCGFDLAA